MNTSIVTKSISIFLLVVFAFYAVTAISMGGFLFASAAGLITYGMKGSIELSTAVVIFVGVVLQIITNYYNKKLLVTASKNIEKFTNQFEQTDNKIVNRLARMKKGEKQIEGFANSKGVAYPGSCSKNKIEGFSSTKGGAYPKGGKSLLEGFTSESTAKAGSAEEVDNGAPSADKKEEDIAGESMPSKPIKTKAEEKEAFGGKNDGLFKLGELPSEKKGGPHIDAGTTIMKALGSLKADDIKRMSVDTQNLLETQKSLLGMLSTMKPMLSEGQQLLQTFGTMFGNK